MCYVSIHVDYFRALKEYEQIIRDKKLMLKGLKYGYYAFAILLILAILLSGNYVLAYIPHSSNGSDVNYTFSNDTFYEGMINNGNFTDSYNVKQEQYYTGNYYGTYSFENDVGKTGTQISWIYGLGNVLTSINSNIDGHNFVMNVSSQSSYQGVFDYFTDHQEGFIEFWIYPSVVGTNKEQYITGRDASADQFGIAFIGSGYTIKYLTGHSWTASGNYVINTWYHVKFVFDDDYCSVYLNGILLNTDTYTGTVDRMIISGGFTPKEVFYYDAISYSWFPSYFSFDDKPLYWYFDNTENPYDTWDYYNDTNTFGVFDNFNGINQQFLRLYDQSNVASVYLIQNFGNNKENGTISFYFRYYTDDITSSYPPAYFYLLEDNTKFVQFWIGVGSTPVLYYHSTGYSTTLMNISMSTWYYMELTFDCSEHSLYLSINGISYGNLGMDITAEYVNRVGFDTRLSFDNVLYDIDELTYSFGYKVNDNLLPEKAYLPYYETSSYEFTYDDINSYLEPNTDNPLGWTDLESTGNYVKTATDYINGLVFIQNFGSGIERGLYKDDFYLNDSFIEVKFKLYFDEFFTSNDYCLLQVYSNDTTEVLRLKLATNSEFSFYNTYISDYEVLNENITDYYYDTYQINAYISYEANICLLDFYRINAVYSSRYKTGSYVLPLMSTDKIGLGKVSILSHTTSASSLNIYLDSIEIQSNNTFIPPEYSFVVLNLGSDYFNNHHSLMYFNGYGNLSLGITIYNFGKYDIFDLVDIETNFYDGFYTYLIYDKIGPFNHSNSFFMVWLNNNANIVSLKLDGQKVVVDSFTYWISYDVYNLEMDESYFYVSNSKLYYYYYANKSINEYIIATVDINRTYTRNYYFYCGMYKSSVNFIVQLNVIFTNNYVSFTGSKGLIFKNVLLPQDKIIDKYEFIVSDNNYDYNGSVSGYFTNFKLIYYSDIDTTLLVSNLTDVIPVLILLVVIPIVLYITFKRRFAIIPISEILMSIFCVAQNLLPLYAGIFIWFSCIAYFIVKNRIGG